MTKKTFIILLLALLIASPAFSMGARELSSSEVLVKVLNVEKEEDGVYRLECVRENGDVVVYRSFEDTNEETPVANLKGGEILAVTDTGISTMSIPPQMVLSSVRDVTLAVNLGIYDATFSDPVIPGYGVESTEVADTEVADTAVAEAAEPVAVEASETEELVEQVILTPVSFNPEYKPVDMIPSFSYTMGYVNGLDLASYQEVTPDAAYFLRGILDLSSFDAENVLMGVEDMVSSYESYYQNSVVAGVKGDKGLEPESMEAILALAAPESEYQKYSYAFGYIFASQLFSNGIDIDSEGFVIGLIDGLYNHEGRLTEEEMQKSYEDYQNFLYQTYLESIEQMKEENLKEAMDFLAAKSKEEGIVAIDPNVLLEFTHENPEESATPNATDTVKVNYTLRNLDGVELEKNEGIEFPLNQVIPGFTKALTHMNVGDSATAYVHPSDGYGETGAGSIEPNQLLIFDLDLLEIVTE